MPKETTDTAFAAFDRGIRALAPKELQDIIERTHPYFEELEDHWCFCEETYEGGREWFLTNIFKFFKEGQGEFDDRVKRAYRPNHTREVVELVNKYMFKAEISRKEDDAPDFVKSFWKSATLGRRDIMALMQMVSRKSSTFGKIWVVVDSTASAGVITKADEESGAARVYAYCVKPQSAPDMAFDDQGDLKWILLEETYRDDDFISGSGTIEPRWRLWTQNHWALFGIKKNRGGKNIYYVIDTGAHNLGVVPVIGAEHIASDELYWAPGLIDDCAYMDRAIANYLSNIDAIIQDQTFSQLVIPAQALLPGDEGTEKMVEIGSKRMFTYDAQAGIAPKYISPDPRQAGLILSIITRIVGEIYQTVGMSGERTKQDNATGIDNSSGVAKAYDFERMNAMLVSKAKALEFVENRLVGLVRLYNNDGDAVTIFKDGKSDLVKYPASFDVRGLYDEFEIAASLAMMGAPDKVRQEQMKTLIDKLFPSLADDAVAAIKASVNVNWPPPTALPTGPSPMPPFVTKPAPGSPGGGSKQGQNNKPADKTSGS